jgi:hypothetical protein
MKGDHTTIMFPRVLPGIFETLKSKLPKAQVPCTVVKDVIENSLSRASF